MIGIRADDPRKVEVAKLALALIKRHATSRAAKRDAERVFDRGFVVVELPALEDFGTFAHEVAASGARAVPYHAPEYVNVQAVREGLNLTQDQFALEFGLDPSSVRNWEQNRSRPDTATRVLLKTIARNPEAVRQALLEDGEAA